MLLILTCSEDVTTDMLIPFLGGIDVFRFNIDQWQSYQWDFSAESFTISNKEGQSCTAQQVRCVYLRKPMFFDCIDVPKNGCLENWCREEIEDIFRSLYHSYHAKGKAALVHPGKSPWRKYQQMQLAKQFWPVPSYHICKGRFATENNVVMKSLTQTPIGEGKVLAVKKVDLADLSPDYPWFLQECVDAVEDVTVLYVNGKKFALALDRSTFEGEDYRHHQLSQEMHWYDPQLSEEDLDKIDQFMQATAYSFGRFDFLRDKQGQLHFLELNPNGMWAWMDLDYKLGIFEAVAEEVLRCYHQ